MNELYLAGAVAVGAVAAGGLILLAVRRARPRPARGREENVVPLEIVGEETVVPVRREPAPAPRVPSGPRAPEFDDAPFSVASEPAPSRASAPVPVTVSAGRAAPAQQTHVARKPALILNRGIGPTYDPDDPPELPDSPIQTEWARRLVGEPGAGRMKGVCSGCGTHLSISQQRPVRIACPVCGRTRLLPAA